MSSPSLISSYTEDIINTITSRAPVSIGILRDALQIAEDPAEIIAFYNPELPSACIRLVQERSKGYPILDDEYSVACLRIIVICIQVAHLVTSETIYAFVDEIPLQSGPNITLAEFAISSFYDYYFQTDGPDPPVNPFMDPADAVTLIECLHRERGRLLHNRCTSRPEFWDGWSFIFLPAWLYLVTERISDQLAMAQKLGDLTCRFAAGEFSYVNEVPIVGYFAQTTHTRFWKITGSSNGYHLGYTSLQDSELLVAAVSTKFSIGLPADLDLAYYMHLWAGFCSSASRLDLMLQFVKASFNRLWHALDPSRGDLALTYERLRGVGEFSGAMFGYIMSAVFDNPLVPQAARGPFLGAALEHGIFGLLARTLMFPLPCNYSRMGESDRIGLHHLFNNNFDTIEGFGDLLSQFHPPNAEVLHDSHTEWLRAAQHFGEQCHMYDRGPYVQTYLSRCQTVWKKLGSSLFANQTTGISIACTYPRCPYPTSLGGVPFTCGGCQAVAYCSHRCQYLHWTCELSEGPHVGTCSSSVLTLVKR